METAGDNGENKEMPRKITVRSKTPIHVDNIALSDSLSKQFPVFSLIKRALPIMNPQPLRRSNEKKRKIILNFFLSRLTSSTDY
jgi:hypothetical protein